MDTQTEQQEAVTAPAEPDFEMRLAFAEATVAALMAHKYGEALDGAHEAAEAAQGALSATPDPAEGTPQDGKPFRSNTVLRLAGDLIRKRGWVQGEYEHGTALCAMGAIRTVTRGDGWYQRPLTDGTPVNEIEAVSELLRRITVDTGSKIMIPRWNDSRGDVDDVLRLLY